MIQLFLNRPNNLNNRIISKYDYHWVFKFNLYLKNTRIRIIIYFLNVQGTIRVITFTIFAIKVYYK